MDFKRGAIDQSLGLIRPVTNDTNVKHTCRSAERKRKRAAVVDPTTELDRAISQVNVSL